MSSIDLGFLGQTTPAFSPRLVGKNKKVRFGPDGVLIFDRSNGLHVLFDEIEVPPNLWSRAPRHVSLALTNRCDLSCPFCYAPKTSDELELRSMKLWIDELSSQGCLSIGMGGGEPTLYPDLDVLCEYVQETTKMSVTLTTHGHRMRDRILDTLSGLVDFVRISVDGLGMTYERIRHRPFEDLLRRLDDIQARFNFGLNVVVNEATIGDLDAVASLAAQRGAAEILLLPERPTGGSVGASNETLDLLDQWVRHYTGPVRLSVSEEHRALFPTCDPFPLEGGVRGYVHIDAAGKLRSTSDSPIGIEILETGFMDAYYRLEKQNGGT